MRSKHIFRCGWDTRLHGKICENSDFSMRVLMLATCKNKNPKKTKKTKKKIRFLQAQKVTELKLLIYM